MRSYKITLYKIFYSPESWILNFCQYFARILPKLLHWKFFLGPPSCCLIRLWTDTWFCVVVGFKHLVIKCNKAKLYSILMDVCASSSVYHSPLCLVCYSLFLFENSMELVLCVLNTVSYTVVEPLAAAEAHSFEVSYATQWKRRTKALNIGHRGMGKSFKDHSLKIEWVLLSPTYWF